MQISKIIIIEDEFFVASHLRQFISELGYQVVGIYHSGEDFFKETDWQFDAAILDIFLAEELTGIDVAKEMKVKGKPFIFLTANQDSLTLKSAAKLSPSAYISKPFQTNDIDAALTILSFKNENKNDNPFFIFLNENPYSNERLTLREIEILKVLMDGLSNQQIEDKLFISLSTVKSHARKIYQKFGVTNRIELKTKVVVALETK
jgi:DNA-binding NarL/FixJ family response regulator